MDPNYGDLEYIEYNEDSNMNSVYDNVKSNDILIKDSIISTWNNGIYNELYGGADCCDSDSVKDDDKKSSSDFENVMKTYEDIKKARKNALKNAKNSTNKNKSFKFSCFISRWFYCFNN